MFSFSKFISYEISLNYNIIKKTNIKLDNNGIISIKLITKYFPKLNNTTLKIKLEKFKLFETATMSKILFNKKTYDYVSMFYLKTIYKKNIIGIIFYLDNSKKYDKIFKFIESKTKYIEGNQFFVEKTINTKYGIVKKLDLNLAKKFKKDKKYGILNEIDTFVFKNEKTDKLEYDIYEFEKLEKKNNVWILYIDVDKIYSENANGYFENESGFPLYVFSSLNKNIKLPNKLLKIDLI
jgi:hypothetical protein